MHSSRVSRGPQTAMAIPTEQGAAIQDDPYLRGCIQKFPDWVDKINNKNKHSLRSNTKGYGGKTR
jgi:hypothetical protein